MLKIWAVFAALQTNEIKYCFLNILTKLAADCKNATQTYTQLGTTQLGRDLSG